MVYNKTKKNRYKKKQNGGINNIRNKNNTLNNHNSYNSNRLIPYSNSNSNTNINNDNISNIISDINEKKQTLRNAYHNTITPNEKQYNLIQRAYNNPQFFSKLGQVVKKGLLNAIDNMGNYVGVNLKTPDEITTQLMAVKKTLENTTNLQELSIIGSLVLEAATPFIDPLIDKIVFYGENIAERVGKAILNVILNTLEEIPIYGIIVGTIRSLNTIAVTILSSINTAGLTIQEIRDTMKFTIDEFEGLKKEYMYQLQKQREDSMNRIQNSIQKFNGGGHLKKFRMI